MMTYKERLNHVTTLIFDVDGVLTNGEIFFFKDEAVRFLNAKDGYALQYAVKMGLNVVIITGGDCETLKEHLSRLGVKEIHLRSQDKLQVYSDLKSRLNFKDEQVLYMGDDIPDYQVLKQVGCATCPQDAVVEIKAICHYQSPFFGGQGAVRDVVEQVLRVQGKWMSELAFHW